MNEPTQEHSHKTKKEMMMIPAIHITFELERPLVLPVNYQHLLQSFVYSILPKEDADFLHNKGFQRDNRVFKAFTFSNIQGKKVTFDRKTKKLAFYDEITISISSVMPELVEKTSNFLILTNKLELHGVELSLSQLAYDKHEITKDRITVQALSPITVYRTFEQRDRKKITHYFSPFDPVFSHLVEENFARKFKAITGKNLPDGQLITIRRLKVTNKDKIVTKYKGFWVTGWLGTYEIFGNPEYLSFLLGAGVGSKGSMGHGMIVEKDILPMRN